MPTNLSPRSARSLRAAAALLSHRSAQGGAAILVILGAAACAEIDNQKQSATTREPDRSVEPAPIEIAAAPQNEDDWKIIDLPGTPPRVIHRLKPWGWDPAAGTSEAWEPATLGPLSIPSVALDDVTDALAHIASSAPSAIASSHAGSTQTLAVEPALMPTDVPEQSAPPIASNEYAPAMLVPSPDFKQWQIVQIAKVVGNAATTPVEESPIPKSPATSPPHPSESPAPTPPLDLGLVGLVHAEAEVPTPHTAVPTPAHDTHAPRKPIAVIEAAAPAPAHCEPSRDLESLRPRAIAHAPMPVAAHTPEVARVETPLPAALPDALEDAHTAVALTHEFRSAFPPFRSLPVPADNPSKAVEVAATSAPDHSALTPKTHAEVAPIAVAAVPAPPTAMVSTATAVPAFSPALIPLFLAAATVLSFLGSLAAAFLLSHSTDRSGNSLRTLTINTRLALAFGLAAALITGSCWFGASALAAAPATASTLTSQIILATIALIGCAVCLGFGVACSGALARPIGRIVAQVRDLHAGKLDIQPINSISRGEIGDLARAVDNLGAMVKDVITEFSISSAEVAQAAGQVAVGITGAAAAAGKVASECVQTAGACANSSRLAACSEQTLQRTTTDLNAIDQTIREGADALCALYDRSAQIARIASAIEDISDRTHLVALNASVEAVKAGPTGRQFAVLAEEVRRLAERARNATEEVSTAVRELDAQTRSAADRIARGATQARQSSQATERATIEIKQLASSADGVESSVRAVNAAAREAGVQATQSADAAAQLTTRTTDLRAMLDRFQLDTSRFMPAAAGHAT